MAGGQTILGLRSGLKLFANVRPVKLYKGVPHKIHGIHQQIWNPDLVDMVMIRENTEGLYHSLLRRMEQKAKGDQFGLKGSIAPFDGNEFPDFILQISTSPTQSENQTTSKVIVNPRRIRPRSQLNTMSRWFLISDIAARTSNRWLASHCCSSNVH